MNKNQSTPKHAKRKKRWIIVASIVLLLAAGVGVYTWLTRDTSSTRSEDRIEIVDNRSVAQQQADELLYWALDDGQKVAESSEGLVRLADEAKSDDDEAIYLSALVTLHQHAGSYELALEYANRLDGTIQTDISAALIAGVYFVMGNFPEAAHYYQLAADRSDYVDDPQKDSPYNDYMNRKREAEGQL